LVLVILVAEVCRVLGQAIRKSALGILDRLVHSRTAERATLRELASQLGSHATVVGVYRVRVRVRDDVVQVVVLACVGIGLCINVVSALNQRLKTC
jgi:hypothetical protein